MIVHMYETNSLLKLPYKKNHNTFSIKQFERSVKFVIAL